MNWQIFYHFPTFVTSPEAIPYLFSFFLVAISPLFSNFIETGIVKRHLPPDLKRFEGEINDFSSDAVRKIGFINSIYIATLNSLHVAVKSGGYWVYPAVFFLASTLLTFLILPRISPFDFHGTVLRIRKLRWLWVLSLVINGFLVFLAFYAFTQKPTPMP